jgi:hypothetical protein
MSAQFEINGGLVWGEEDIFEHGCQPDSSYSYDIPLRLTAPSIPELIAKLNSHIGPFDDDAVLLDSCDEDGRLDVQVYVTDENITASAGDIEGWREGKQRLWLATYFFSVELVERKTVPLTERKIKRVW